MKISKARDSLWCFVYFPAGQAHQWMLFLFYTTYGIAYGVLTRHFQPRQSDHSLCCITLDVLASEHTFCHAPFPLLLKWSHFAIFYSNVAQIKSFLSCSRHQWKLRLMPEREQSTKAKEWSKFFYMHKHDESLFCKLSIKIKNNCK